MGSFREKAWFFFFKISILLDIQSRSLKCPLHIASYALRIGVSVMELKVSEFLISNRFQRKRYIPILRKFYNACVRSLFEETIPYMCIYREQLVEAFSITNAFLFLLLL